MKVRKVVTMITFHTSFVFVKLISISRKVLFSFHVLKQGLQDVLYNLSESKHSCWLLVHTSHYAVDMILHKDFLLQFIMLIFPVRYLLLFFFLHTICTAIASRDFIQGLQLFFFFNCANVILKTCNLNTI